MTDTELLDFLESRKDLVVGYAPSGSWAVFPNYAPKMCYGSTLREAVEKAAKYNFPSGEGYQRMKVDEASS